MIKHFLVYERNGISDVKEISSIDFDTVVSIMGYKVMNIHDGDYSAYFTKCKHKDVYDKFTDLSEKGNNGD